MANIVEYSDLAERITCMISFKFPKNTPIKKKMKKYNSKE